LDTDSMYDVSFQNIGYNKINKPIRLRD